jgi:hypothetical protein
MATATTARPASIPGKIGLGQAFDDLRSHPAPPTSDAITTIDSDIMMH